MALGIDSIGKVVETDKIQQAIDSVIASPDKDTLYFPNGCYRTDPSESRSMRIPGRRSLDQGSLNFDDYPVFGRYQSEAAARV